MPMQWDRYPPNWKELSLALRIQAGWQCEWCHVPNGTYRLCVKGKPYKVVLTVAHLGTPYSDGSPGDKHNKMDVRPENLAVLCNACHLCYDVDEHRQHSAETRYRKKLSAGQLELFSLHEDDQNGRVE